MVRGRELPRLREQCDDCASCNPIELEEVILVMAQAMWLREMPKTRTLPAPGSGQRRSRGTHSITVNSKVDIIFTWSEPHATDLTLECRK